MSDIVQKLWGFCHTLRHDAVDFHQPTQTTDNSPAIHRCVSEHDWNESVSDG